MKIEAVNKMQEIDAIQTIIISAIPALGALLLSLYNWFISQQGAKIRPLPFVHYGLWCNHHI